MAKVNKLQKEVQMAQIEVQKFQLQVNKEWEVATMANQAKVKLYDQLIEKGDVELGEALEKVEAEFKRWHFEQIKGYVNVLDVAYQQIAPSDKTEDDATTEGEIRPNKEQGKSIEEVRKGKKILANANIVDISNDDETTPLSQFHL